MTTSKSPIDPLRLEIRPLSPGDTSGLAAFSCGDVDLDGFLRDDALRLQDQNVVRAYLATYDGALVGYAAILTDAVVLATGERKKLRLTSGDHPIVPALKVARLAVDQAFRKNHRGVGEALMRFILDIALDVAGNAGCRLLTVDAYTESIAFYEGLGFLRNKAARRGGPAEEGAAVASSTASMRFDIFSPAPPPWAA